MSSSEPRIVFHKGVYKKAATLSEAVFLITGVTIGAGILGLPYAIAQVGLKVGIFYIIALGMVILLLNLMLGEVVAKTKEPLQIAGLARKYIGRWAEYVLLLSIISGSYGALLAYIIGEGETAGQLFGGNAVWWSVIFWIIASLVVWRGLETAKRTQKIMGILVIGLIILLSAYLIPHGTWAHSSYTNWSKLFFPFGVILFALHGAPGIAEAEALLPRQPKKFRKALILGTLIPIVVYVLFTIGVVSVTGKFTTEVATVGLDAIFGRGVVVISNVFAMLAMGTAFVGLGIALKQTFVWDTKFPPWLAILLTIGVPIILFLAGLRSFIAILNIVGGVFISLEAVLTIVIYWRARHQVRATPAGFGFHHVWLVVIPVLAVFAFMGVWSILGLVL